MDGLGTRFNMPTFDVFCERLSREQSHLSQLDQLSGSKNKALVAQSSKEKEKQKQKLKPKKNSAGSESSSKPPPKSDFKPPFPPKQGKSSQSGEPSSKTKKKSGDTCSFCGKEGYQVSRCWKWLEALEEAMQQHHISSPQASYPSKGKGHALTARASSYGSTWILDSGASHHMTHTQQMVTSLASCGTSQIAVGESVQLSVLGLGFVSLDGGTLQDVLVVPDISTNLLSIYQIFHSGSSKTAEFSPHDVVIRDLHDSDLVVATGSVDIASRLYKFDGFEPSEGASSSLIAHADSVSKIWHEQLGHVNYRYLQQMSTQALVLGLPQISCTDGVFHGCVLGKQHRDPFLKGRASHALAALELIHSDLMSFPTPSFSRAKYVLTFIDDFSRRTWVYFLKYKSDVFDSFRIFKTYVEKRSGCSIQWICTDNGGEYVNQAFRDFCTKHGLQQQFTVPYTPQQNGVAEHKNRTLWEMMNCMIQSKSMDSSFWAEAVNCANYIQNRMSHKAIRHMTPEEAWSHDKPDVSFFWVFGSEAWAFIPDAQRKSMERKS